MDGEGIYPSPDGQKEVKFAAEWPSVLFVSRGDGRPGAPGSGIQEGERVPGAKDVPDGSAVRPRPRAGNGQPALQGGSQRRVLTPMPSVDGRNTHGLTR